MSFTSARAARWSDVYLAAGARGVSVCGDFLAATALVLALQGAGAGGWAVATVLIASTIPPVLLAPLTGRLVDRYDSRVLLTATGLAQAVVCAGLAYVHGIVPIVALVAALAAGLAISGPTLTSLVPVMVGRDHLARAGAIGQASVAVGMLAAPALGGLLVGRYGLRLPLLLDAGSYVAIVAAGLAIRTRRGGRFGYGPDHVDLPDGEPTRWTLRRDPLLLAVIVLVGVVVAAINATNVAEVFFIRETLGASTTTYGLVSSVLTLSLLVGAILTGRLKLSDPGLAYLMAGLLAMMGATILAAATVPSVAWLLPLWIICGLANGGINVVVGVLVARRTSARLRGRVSATLGAVVNGANTIGYFAGGALLAVIPSRQVIGWTGVAGLVAVGACLPVLARAARREPVAGAEAPVAVAPAAPEAGTGPDRDGRHAYAVSAAAR